MSLKAGELSHRLRWGATKALTAVMVDSSVAARTTYHASRKINVADTRGGWGASRCVRRRGAARRVRWVSTARQTDRPTYRQAGKHTDDREATRKEKHTPPPHILTHKHAPTTSEDKGITAFYRNSNYCVKKETRERKKRGYIQRASSGERGKVRYAAW